MLMVHCSGGYAEVKEMKGGCKVVRRCGRTCSCKSLYSVGYDDGI